MDRVQKARNSKSYNLHFVSIGEHILHPSKGVFCVSISPCSGKVKGSSLTLFKLNNKHFHNSFFSKYCNESYLHFLASLHVRISLAYSALHNY
jgi:hypothetical protein